VAAPRGRCGSRRPSAQPYVKSAPCGFLRLVTLFTTALTSTVPASCAGASTVHSVLDAQLADFYAVAPNLNFVAVVPGANPTPVTVTVEPPAAGPAFGVSEAISGANL
jgi:hypothetical protein